MVWVVSVGLGVADGSGLVSEKVKVSAWLSAQGWVKALA
jgi:hypothetical protein